jgi:RNAse (barnase) inhibitor barstar
MTARHKRVYEIDGTDFTSLEGFYDAISKELIPSAVWGRNLDAFNDILRGGGNEGGNEGNEGGKRGTA